MACLQPSPRLKTPARLQWPASYKAGARAWTAEQYATKVRGMAEALVAAKAAGKTVHWVRPCRITQMQGASGGGGGSARLQDPQGAAMLHTINNSAVPCLILHAMHEN